MVAQVSLFLSVCAYLATRKLVMIRSRFTRVAFALGLGLMSGCLCLRSHPLFQKKAAGAGECECATGMPGMSEGPMLGDAGSTLPP